MSKYKIGDIVWYVPGYRGSSLIAIKCKITNCFAEYGSVYDMDIPVGHSVAADELFLDEADAKNELLERYQQELLGCEQMSLENTDEFAKDLQDASTNYLSYFLNTVGFICSTHEVSQRWSSFQECVKHFSEDHETINIKQALNKN